MAVAILLLILVYLITGLARNILYIYEFFTRLDEEEEDEPTSKKKLVE